MDAARRRVVFQRLLYIGQQVGRDLLQLADISKQQQQPGRDVPYDLDPNAA
jgi:hypothetical protein